MTFPSVAPACHPASTQRHSVSGVRRTHFYLQYCIKLLQALHSYCLKCFASFYSGLQIYSSSITPHSYTHQMRLLSLIVFFVSLLTWRSDRWEMNVLSKKLLRSKFTPISLYFQRAKHTFCSDLNFCHQRWEPLRRGEAAPWSTSKAPQRTRCQTMR